MTSRIIRALDGVSSVLNVIIYNGDPNYSISGDAYRKERIRTRRFIDWLFSPFEADHCRLAYENDLRKARELVKRAPE